MNKQAALTTKQTSSSTAAPSGILMRKCASCSSHTIAGAKCSECEDKNNTLQRKESGSAGMSGVPPSVREVLHSPGRPLDKATREFFEPRFAYDFSKVSVSSVARHASPGSLTIGESASVFEQEADRMAASVMRKENGANGAGAFGKQHGGFDLSRVRIHNDARAAESAREINALAYTVGNDVVFGAGQFAPGTSEGRRLLAHELTHVLQQQPQAAGVQAALIQKQHDDKKKPKKQQDPKKKPDEKKGEKKDEKKAEEKEKPKKTANAELSQKFEKEEEAQKEVKRLESLGIEAVGITTRNKKFIINFFRASKAEARKQAAEKQKSLDKGLEAGTDYDEPSASHYVRIYLKCPEGVKDKKGFEIWPECYTRGAAKTEAEKQRQKLILGYGTAELFERADATGYAIYYKPLADKDVTEGQAAATKQLEADKKQGPLKKCSEGFTDKGKYRLTTYFLPAEKDYPEKPVKTDPCGVKGDFRDEFLNDVVLQGTGVSLKGQFIKFTEKVGKNFCYKIHHCNSTKDGPCAAAGRSVAVDPSDIPLGSKLFIEGVGARVAEDVGGMINDKHIDIYRGMLKRSEALKLTMTDKRVCIEKKEKKK